MKELVKKLFEEETMEKMSDMDYDAGMAEGKPEGSKFILLTGDDVGEAFVVLVHNKHEFIIEYFEYIRQMELIGERHYWCADDEPPCSWLREDAFGNLKHYKEVVE